jgi:hypothetical protein
MTPTGVDIGTAFPIAQNFPSLASLISIFIPRLLLAAGIIFFILVIGAGVRVIMMAGGEDPHAQEQAKNFLTLSVTGLIIIFGAYWVLQIINYVTNGTLSNLVP